MNKHNHPDNNIIEYLHQLGHLTLEEEPFNIVDNVVLACGAYTEIEKVLPGIMQNHNSLSYEEIPVTEICEAYFACHSREELEESKSLARVAPFVFEAMANSRRFGKTTIRNLVSRTSVEEETQFTAMEYCLEDGTSYIAFRGTDDTIVGWKESFNMTCQRIPSEEAALEYVNSVCRQEDRSYRIGGHSKGGHLAVYSSALCHKDVQDRIIAIYNNEGPGFSQAFLNEPGYKQIRERICRIIPEGSVIGMLLDNDVEPIIVKSLVKGLVQHDGTTWQTEGGDFVRTEELTRTARNIKSAFTQWLPDITLKNRDNMIDDIFGIVEITGTFQEMTEELKSNLRGTIRDLRNLDGYTKDQLNRFVLVLTRTTLGRKMPLTRSIILQDMKSK